MRATPVVTVLLFLLGAPVLSAEGVKIVCAARAGGAIRIDGVLDEPAWQRAESIEDFLEIGDPVPHPTRMRLLYDDNTLYLGVECTRSDVDRLKKGMADFLAKQKGKTGYRIGDFVNQYSLEVFLDPGASGVNSYQFLVNIAGQSTGQFNGDFDPFPVRPAHKSSLTDTGWTTELAFPMASMLGAKLVEGEAWGFNLVRNDKRDSACVIWRPVGPIFYTPSQYGRMVVGDYATWWRRQVEEQASGELTGIGHRMGSYQKRNRHVKPLYEVAQRKIEALRSIKNKSGLKTREGFLMVYRQFPAVASAVHRLRALCATLDGQRGPSQGGK